MPDSRKHRGPHPQDEQDFAPRAVPVLNRAVGDLCWLLSQGYSSHAACKLVGDRFQLTDRQRLAVLRCSCSHADRRDRQRRQVAPQRLTGMMLDVDGFNVLTTVEAALAGGFLLLARDGCLRDMASVHGSFRCVQETSAAIQCVGRVLAEREPAAVRWLLDRPVSNSGRLAARLREMAAQHDWPWQVELADDVDGRLAHSPHVVATADGPILSRCARWYNLAYEVVYRQVPGAKLLRLTGWPSAGTV